MACAIASPDRINSDKLAVCHLTAAATARGPMPGVLTPGVALASSARVPPCRSSSMTISRVVVEHGHSIPLN